MKLTTPSQEHLEKHYEDLSAKPFFKGLVAYMLSGPICAMVWEGKDVVKTGRTILGATNPLASAPGTIRGDYAIVRASLQSTLSSSHTDPSLGCRPQRLPRFRLRRAPQEADRHLVHYCQAPKVELRSFPVRCRANSSFPSDL